MSLMVERSTSTLPDNKHVPHTVNHCFLPSQPYALAICLSFPFRTLPSLRIRVPSSCIHSHIGNTLSFCSDLIQWSMSLMVERSTSTLPACWHDKTCSAVSVTWRQLGHWGLFVLSLSNLASHWFVPATSKTSPSTSADSDNYVPSSSSSEDKRETPLKSLKKRKLCNMSSSNSDDE